MTSIPSSKPWTETPIVRTLLASIVDYAGLFPPARLDVEAAAAAFGRYRRAPHAWMLGSFVVPAARVGELAREARGDPASHPWPVSVIVESAGEGARVVEEVGRRHAGALAVTSLEVRPLGVGEIREGGETLRAALVGTEVFHEVPLDDEIESRLDAVEAVGASAKVRTGGITADAFPSAEALAWFMTACRERDLAFKATAGLHHAFAGSYPLTCEPGSACAAMHGFLGLTLTAALVREHGIGRRETADLLAGEVAALDVVGEAAGWHGRWLTEEELSRTRQSFFRAFGSCSFEEPVAELAAFGL